MTPAEPVYAPGTSPSPLEGIPGQKRSPDGQAAQAIAKDEGPDKVSSCCQADLKVETADEGTSHYRCWKCGEACDQVTKTAKATGEWVSRCCEVDVTEAAIGGERVIKRCTACKRVCETVRAVPKEGMRTYRCVCKGATAFESRLPLVMAVCPGCKSGADLFEVKDGKARK